MNNILFAHAGHLHTETVTNAGITFNYTTVMWAILIIGMFLLFVTSHFVAKAKITTSMLATSLFLLTFSIFSYLHVGPYSFIALVGGLGLGAVVASLKRTATQQ